MVINHKKMWGPFTHHWHLEGIDIKRSDFPVTADIVDELDQTMKPKHSRNDQDENHENIFLDAKIEKKNPTFYIFQNAKQTLLSSDPHVYDNKKCGNIPAKRAWHCKEIKTQWNKHKQTHWKEHNLKGLTFLKRYSWVRNWTLLSIG